MASPAAGVARRNHDTYAAGRPLFLTDPRAACRNVPDPNVFFGPHGGINTGEAKRVCRNCPLKSPCLTWAVAQPDLYGVWGGASGLDRKHLRSACERPGCRICPRLRPYLGELPAAPPPPAVPHGINGYQHHRCRCDICRTAATAWRRDRRARQDRRRHP